MNSIIKLKHISLSYLFSPHSGEKFKEMEFIYPSYVAISGVPMVDSLIFIPSFMAYVIQGYERVF